jgi:prepilin-type N-terminal cleavage/methylation domain-containing protein/prepilin-type processing-associated H-X9-DG protein
MKSRCLISEFKHPQSSRGFTLVELLVVITIIGILIALLLPAVQAAREAARRMQCQNNLKQLGLGLLNYEGQSGIFPPSSHSPSGVDPASGNATSRRENWVIMVLPFMEQQGLYDRFDRTKPITDPINMTPRSVQLIAMLCPTDSFNRQPFMGSQGSTARQFADNWARGNYGANASLGIPWLGTNPLCAGDASSPGWANNDYRGVMGNNASVGMARITDGTSNTVLLAELRAGVTAVDSRGVWAMGGPGSSALWAHGGIYGSDYGPNCPYDGSDDVMDCNLIQDASGGAAALAAAGMGCYNHIGNAQQTARSMHAGGVNTCFADGSIHWTSDFIQAYPSSHDNLSAWDRLMASADGQIVTNDAY